MTNSFEDLESPFLTGKLQFGRADTEWEAGPASTTIKALLPYPSELVESDRFEPWQEVLGEQEDDEGDRWAPGSTEAEESLGSAEDFFLTIDSPGELDFEFADLAAGEASEGQAFAGDELQEVDSAELETEEAELEAFDLEALLATSGDEAAWPEHGRVFEHQPDQADSEAPSTFALEAEAPPSDEVDAFLESRKSLYKVMLVGTNVHVTLPRSYEWTARYTDRALSEGGVGAAFSVIYMGGAKSAQIKQAYAKLIGNGVKFTPAEKKMQGVGAIHTVIIEESAMKKFAEALNLPPKYISEKWRPKFGEAKFIKFGLDEISRTFDSQLLPHFPEKALTASKMSVELIRRLLEKKKQSMIEVAKTHPVTAPWREAYKRNLALHWAEREPLLTDFGNTTPAQWAKIALEIATATRKRLVDQSVRSREEDRKHFRNEHLRPHEIKVDDAAKFIVDNFHPTNKVQLYTTLWIVHGGLHMHNIKQEPIFLLSASKDRIVYQHLGNKKFYQQTLDGFSDEQLYGIYVAAGQKAQGAIALTKWVTSLLGAVFPPVKFGILATDVLNAAFQIKENRPELERSYEGMKLAYSNIDGLLPGVLPKIWDAVLDKRNAALFNPLKNPDAGAWVTAIIRLVLWRQARIVTSSYASDAVTGFFKKAFTAIAKGLGTLKDVAKILLPAVAGSTGVSGQRAMDLAQQRLRQLGVADALAIALLIKQLSEADRERLSREIQDFIKNGTALMDVIKKSLSW